VSEEGDWDDVWESVEPMTPEDWDAVIGEPPDWYFPLVGRIAVATGGLERRLAETALRLLGWPQERGGDLFYWLESSARLGTLLGRAQGGSPAFDDLSERLPTMRGKRNEAVHVATGWHDWDSPEEPSGWHYEHPRSRTRVYLNAQAQAALERVLKESSDLDQQVWNLFVSLGDRTD
jgi:hypothetical protein